MKIALVHDYLIQAGGAERVLEVFQRMWPEAPTYVLMHDPKRVGPAFDGKDIRTSFLQRIPFATRKYQYLMPFMPTATESYDLRGYDVVLSSTSAFAKGIITQPETLHLCYCHTPTRYLWSDTHTYLKESSAPFFARPFLPGMLSKLRSWDRLAADRVDRFIANSDTVRHRIRKYYRADSTVIHPPVETTGFKPSDRIDNYYVAGGRFVNYKRFDLVIRAFNKLGISLKIFGSGPDYPRLKAMAGKNVEFVGRVNDAEKADLYAHAIAYLHPQEEDFGITAVEAMAAGRPVIAYGKGGARETVIPGVTGALLEEQSWEDLAGEIIRFKPETFDPTRIRQHAETFSTANFEANLRRYVEEEWRGWNC